MSEPVFFRSAAEWRAWLGGHHAAATEIVFGFHKVATGKAGVTYQQALDEALAFGWIDGIRRGGTEHWTIRFTPRKPKSVWSAVNIRRVEELTALGRMHPAGLKAFEARDPGRQKRYSNENRSVALAPEYEKQFRADRRAWAWFEAMMFLSVFLWLGVMQLDSRRRRPDEQALRAAESDVPPAGAPSPVPAAAPSPVPAAVPRGVPAVAPSPVPAMSPSTAPAMPPRAARTVLLVAGVVLVQRV